MMNEQLDELIGDVVVPTPAESTPTEDDNAPLPDAELVEPEPEVSDEDYEISSEPTELTEQPQEPTPPPAKEPVKPEPQTVPLPVYMELKHEFRDLKRDIERQIAASAQKPQTEPDPIDVYLDSLGDDAQDAAIPASVYKKHEAWKQKQQAVTTEDTFRGEQEKAFNYAASVTMSERALGAGLGLEQVIEIGSKHLSARDREMIRDADPAVMAREYYVRCVERTMRSGTQDAITLGNRIRAARAGKTETPPTPPKPKTEVPGREAVLKGNWPHADKLGLTETP